LARAAELVSPEEAKRMGVELKYINTGKVENPVEELMNASGGEGYNDVFVFAPVAPVVEQADKILAKDGCLNFFAGPTNTEFSASLNFYNVHYKATHIVGTSGGNTDDMREAISMMEQGLINPAGMISHVGGLNSVPETTLNLNKVRAGKMLVYNNINMPMTAIADFEELGRSNKMFADLHEIVKKNNFLWCPEAEKYLLEHAEKI